MNFSLHRHQLTRVPPIHRTLVSTTRRWLARIGHATWHALEAQGRLRAQKALREAADRYEITQPELARQLRAASRYDACR
jgi:hypothetical protein